MISGGDQCTKNMKFVGSEWIKRDDDTLKCVVHSAVILFETFLVVDFASQLGLGLHGMVRSTSTVIHVNEPDGSCTSLTGAHIEIGKD